MKAVRLSQPLKHRWLNPVTPDGIVRLVRLLQPANIAICESVKSNAAHAGGNGNAAQTAAVFKSEFFDGCVVRAVHDRDGRQIRII